MPFPSSNPPGGRGSAPGASGTPKSAPAANQASIPKTAYTPRTTAPPTSAWKPPSSSPSAAGARAAAAGAGAATSTATGGGGGGAAVRGGAAVVGGAALGDILVIAGGALVITEGLFPSSAADAEAKGKGKPDPRKNGTLPGLYPPDSPQTTTPGTLPFTGGQMPVFYTVYYYQDYIDPPYHERVEQSKSGFRGPITGVKKENNILSVYANGYGSGQVNVPGWYVVQDLSNPRFTSVNQLFITRVETADGQPDTGGNPPPITSPEYSSSGDMSFSYDPFDFVSPTSPSAPPALTAPARPDKLPGVRPPRAPQPDPTVAQPEIAPSPEPQKVPQTNPTSRTFWDPIPSQVTPSTGVGPDRLSVDLNIPPVPIPSQGTAPQTPTSPAHIPEKSQPITFPSGDAPTPAGQPTPTTTPKATSSSPSPDSSAPPWWAYIAFPAIVGALTPLINNTSPSAIGTAVCNTFAPGGCNADVRQNAKDAADNSAANKNLLERIFDGLGNTASLANLAMIPKILTKLTKFVDWSVGDRVVGMMSMVASVHNAFMLSNNVGQTLFSIFDNLGNTGKLIVNPEGDADIDSKAWVTSNLDSLFSTMLGAEVWKSVKTSYRAANNIFSTSSNMYDNLRSIHNDSQELLNMVRRDTAELGNALVEEGVISEDNWDIRDPKLKIKSKMLNRLDRMNRGLEDLDNKLEAIEQLTSTLLNIANSAKEIRENTDKLGKELGDANQAFKDTRDKAIEALPDMDFDINDLF